MDAIPAVRGCEHCCSVRPRLQPALQAHLFLRDCFSVPRLDFVGSQSPSFGGWFGGHAQDDSLWPQDKDTDHYAKGDSSVLRLGLPYCVTCRICSKDAISTFILFRFHKSTYRRFGRQHEWKQWGHLVVTSVLVSYTTSCQEQKKPQTWLRLHSGRQWCNRTDLLAVS